MHNSARDFMFLLCCIQSLRSITIPVLRGVATQDKMLMKGLVVTDKSERIFRFHKNTLHLANELLAAVGKSSYEEVDGSIFMHGDEFTYLSDLYFLDNLGSVTKY